MKLLHHVSLKPYNTFGLDVSARLFAEFRTVLELQALLQLPEVQEEKKLILGGGSNVLFTQDFDGVVLRNSIKGMAVLREDEAHVYLRSGAGESWHDLVLHCIERGYAGIENLSLIPGTVGAAPMQNIGAYGVELREVFDSLEAVHIASGEIVKFDNEGCAFGYRQSIFKQQAKDQYIITHVTFRLNKTPRFNTSYGAIKTTLEQMQVKDEELTLRHVSDAVISIRKSKLPDPVEIGNAGSFFKNPEIPAEQYAALKGAVPGYPLLHYFSRSGESAGWLADRAVRLERPPKRQLRGTPAPGAGAGQLRRRFRQPGKGAGPRDYPERKGQIRHPAPAGSQYLLKLIVYS